MSPRYINSLMKEPAGRQSQFEGAEKQIDVNGGGGAGAGVGGGGGTKEILQT